MATDVLSAAKALKNNGFRRKDYLLRLRPSAFPSSQPHTRVAQGAKQRDGKELKKALARKPLDFPFGAVRHILKLYRATFSKCVVLATTLGHFSGVSNVKSQEKMQTNRAN